MQCSKCKGEGYKLITVIYDGNWQTVKKWCEECQGSGEVSYKGDRSGIGWEGE